MTAGRSNVDVAVEYFARLDRGETPLDLFQPDAELAFPKWGVAHGRREIAALYAALARRVRRLTHGVDAGSVIDAGSRVVVEGRTAGVLRDGTPWAADDRTFTGQWCAVMEFADGLIVRCHVYLDPDFGAMDRDRYPWLVAGPLGN